MAIPGRPARMTAWGKARAAEGKGDEAMAEALQDARKESAAALGFSSVMAAYGAFFIPKSYGTSIDLTGGPEGALYAFIAYYVTCILVTWWWYSRKGTEMPC
jgi:NNP family nitrate/nitrite transporter-like MFS transporter